MTFDSPIIFAGNSMIQRMNWNYIFQKIADEENYSVRPPIVFNRGISGNKTGDILRRLEGNILLLNPTILFCHELHEFSRMMTLRVNIQSLGTI